MADRMSVLGPRRRALAGGLLTAAGVIALVLALVGQQVAADNPDAKEHHFSFINDTGAEANGLQIVFNGPVKKPIADAEIGGCPRANTSAKGSIVVIEWDEKCIEPGEKVFVTVFSKEPVEAGPVTWTNGGLPVDFTPGPTQTGVIPLPSLPPSTATHIPPPATIPFDTPVPPVGTATPTPFGPGPLPTITLTPTVTPTAPTSTPTPSATSNAPAVTHTATPSLGRGDVNCDDNVNSIDAALLLQLIAGLLSALDCDGDADVNQNGAVDSIDVAIMLQFVAGLVARLPV